LTDAKSGNKRPPQCRGQSIGRIRQEPRTVLIPTGAVTASRIASTAAATWPVRERLTPFVIARMDVQRRGACTDS
jgi:hypothetical protein